MDRTLSEKFWGENLFGIPYSKVRTFLSALLSAAVGMVFLSLGMRGMVVPSDYRRLSIL